MTANEPRAKCPDDFCRTCRGTGRVSEPVQTFTGAGYDTRLVTSPCPACLGTGQGH